MAPRKKPVKKTDKPQAQAAKVTKPAETEESVTEIPAVKEPTVEKEPEIAAAPESPKPEARPAKSSPVPLLVGGLVAAGIGFGAAQFTGNGSWPFQREDPTAVEVEKLIAVVADQQDQIAGMASNLTELQAAIQTPDEDPRVDGLNAAIADIQSDLATAIADLDALSGRLMDVENRPVADPGASADATAAYERELAAMRQMFQDELARVEAMQSDAVTVEQSAEEAARQANIQAAMSGLQSSIDNGTEFGAVLDQLAGAGVDVPKILRIYSSSGVATLTDLQGEFPTVARAALDAAIKAQVESGEISRISAFFRTQLGTRSLEAREGDDPDAVLSRAEAALGQADIPGALAELKSLPKPALQEMRSWVVMARSRQDVLKAADKLAENLPE